MADGEQTAASIISARSEQGSASDHRFENLLSATMTSVFTTRLSAMRPANTAAIRNAFAEAWRPASTCANSVVIVTMTRPPFFEAARCAVTRRRSSQRHWESRGKRPCPHKNVVRTRQPLCHPAPRDKQRPAGARLTVVMASMRAWTVPPRSARRARARPRDSRREIVFESLLSASPRTVDPPVLNALDQVVGGQAN